MTQAQQIEKRIKEIGNYAFNVQEFPFILTLIEGSGVAPTVEVGLDLGISKIDNEYQLWYRSEIKDGRWKAKGLGKFKALDTAVKEMITKLISIRLKEL